uniref:CBF1-interacting co-repressor CIR N-terminal domain-containing protein n=1 Tax=Hyaloperonospora arabidopsidis (strain Emoy2) TaxID=559515 RepID=M4BAZ7_HYAAE
MSLQFLSQKSWHPANKANQKHIWMAEQEAIKRREREQDKVKEVRKAVQAQRTQEAATYPMAPEHVNFLYAAPPGLVQVTTDGAREKQQRTIEEDEAVCEFRRKAARRGESQRKLERDVGHRAQETLTIKDQVDRFPVLKGAPVEGKYTETIRVQFNPLGLRLRNVRCLRCSEWGHQSGDRECRLRNVNPNDAARQRWEDPVTEIKKLKMVKQELVLRRGALPLEMQEDGGEFEILPSDDDEAEDAFLAGLSAKQRKRSLKKLRKSSDSSDRHSDPDLSRRQARSKKVGRHKQSSAHKHEGKRNKRSKRRSRDDNDSGKLPVGVVMRQYRRGKVDIV